VKKPSMLVLLLLIAIASLFSALLFGRYPVSLSEVVQVFLEQLNFGPYDLSVTTRTVVLDVRLPRVVAAMLIGSALSVAGAAYQGLLKNPLVSPDILGASTGAGFGAALALIMSWSLVWVQLSAFLFGILAVILVYQISRLIRQSDPILTLVLTGLLIGTIFSSLISVMKYVADPFDKLPSITYWLMGSLSTTSMGDVKFAVFPVVFGMIPLILLRWKLNVMSFGEEEAMALGVNTKGIRFVVIFCATLMTAAVVSISGIIGWVGLLIPHFVRSLVGPDFRLLLPGSILVGGTYLVWVDTFSRTLLPLEIPLGILTSLVGAPFFLYLLVNSRRGWQ